MQVTAIRNTSTNSTSMWWTSKAIGNISSSCFYSQRMHRKKRLGKWCQPRRAFCRTWLNQKTMARWVLLCFVIFILVCGAGVLDVWVHKRQWWLELRLHQCCWRCCMESNYVVYSSLACGWNTSFPAVEGLWCKNACHWHAALLASRHWPGSCRKCCKNIGSPTILAWHLNRKIPWKGNALLEAVGEAAWLDTGMQEPFKVKYWLGSRLSWITGKRLRLLCDLEMVGGGNIFKPASGNQCCWARLPW